MKRSTLVVGAAAAANVGVAAAKLVAAATSGSSALLAEGFHSLADTGNELLLLLGERRARRPADAQHPYGHGKELFFWGLLVALLLFTLGGGMSIYEGIERLSSPGQHHISAWDYAVLAVAALLEGSSFLVARKHQPAKARGSIVRAIHFGKDPAVYTVLAEDAAALVGLAIAAAGMALEQRGVRHADAIASIAIGLLLCAVAVLLVWEARGLLIGERASRDVVETVGRVAREEPAVEDASAPLTMQLGPAQVLLNLAVRFQPGLASAELADAIERITVRIRDEHPQITHVFIEAQPRAAGPIAPRSAREPAPPSGAREPAQPPAPRGPRSTASMAAVSAALAAIFLLSNAPTPLYQAYSESFGFSEVVLTLVYAAYVAGTIATLFFLGRLSDQIGRRPVAVASLLGAIGAAVLFLFARSTAWLFAARVASGVAIALASGACTAWLAELEPRQDRARATQLALGANTLGLALGPLGAGLLAELAPAPLRLTYVACIPLLLGAAIAASRASETIDEKKPLRQTSLAPRLGVPREQRARFLPAAIAAFATFAMLGFYSALIPGVLRDALHIDSAAAAGGVVAAPFLISLLAIAFAPRVDPRKGMIAGLALLVPCVAALVAAQAARSLALLVASTALGGISSGLGYRFGLQVVNELAPDEKRSEVISAYLVVCYLAISLPVIGVGLLAGAVGSLAADAIFGAVVALLAVAALFLEAGKAQAGAARSQRQGGSS